MNVCLLHGQLYTTVQLRCCALDALKQVHVSVCMHTVKSIDIKQRCPFSKLAARMGASFHGVLRNACNFLVACSCVGTD